MLKPKMAAYYTFRDFHDPVPVRVTASHMSSSQSPLLSPKHINLTSIQVSSLVYNLIDVYLDSFE